MLTAKFSVGQSVAARVLWSTFMGAASRNGNGEKGERAVSAGELGQRVMQLSMRKSELESGANIGARLTWRTKDALTPGSIVHGVVRDVNSDGAWILLSQSLSGFVHAAHCSKDDDVAALSKKGPAGCLRKGDIVQAAVLHCDSSKYRLELTLRDSIVSKGVRGVEEYRAPGAVVVCRVPSAGARHNKVADPPAVAVEMERTSLGRVCLTHVTDAEYWRDATNTRRKAAGALKFGTFSLGVVMPSSVPAKGRFDLTLRPSIVSAAMLLAGKKKTKSAVTKMFAEDAVSEGNSVRGYVVGMNKAGCFVRLSSTMTGRVMLKNLSDGFVADPKEAFPIGKLVTARVLAVSGRGKQRRAEISLKASHVKSDGAAKHTLESLAAGCSAADEAGTMTKLTGFVRKVEKFGVFVNISQSDGLSGLCHISECADEFVNDLNTLFKQGDRVKVCVLKVDKKRISLGMKPSYFAGDEEEEDEDEEMVAEEGEEDEEEEEEDDNDDDDDDDEVVDSDSDDAASDAEEGREKEGAKPVTGKKRRHDESDSDSESGSDSGSDSDTSSGSDDEDDEDSRQKRRKLMHTSVGLGFGNSKKQQAGKRSESGSDSESDSDDDDDSSKSKHASSRRKRADRKREEEQIAAREMSLLDGTAAPETVGDFERLVASTPNNSFVWIKYMSYQISVMEHDLARSVGERALKKINFRDEGERMNVWVAYLNLEHIYGDAESFDALFKRAVQNNDPLTLYLRTADSLAKSGAGAARKTREMFVTIQKKFGSKSTAVWIQSARYHLEMSGSKKNSSSSESTDGVQELLSEAVQRLPRSKHLEVTSKFAQLEFSLGSAERGRTIFEGIVAAYPKKLDIWNVYLDQEVKLYAHGGRRARQLFERLVSMKLSTKKMKFLFKKYLAFEAKHGSVARQEAVKQMARDWVAAREDEE